MPTTAGQQLNTRYGPITETLDPSQGIHGAWAVRSYLWRIDPGARRC